MFSGTVLLLALQLGGCAASLARKIRLEAVQEVRTYGTAGADLTLWMTNESRRTVRLEAACVDFYTDSVFLGRVRLRDTVVLAKRSSEEVKSRWKNESPDVADHARAFEHQREQGRRHIEQRHDHHDDQDDGRIDIVGLEPVEECRIEGLHADSRIIPEHLVLGIRKAHIQLAGISRSL